MTSKKHQKGGTVGLRRLLTGIGATFAAVLLLAASASAKTVYDYVYSGTYIDGTAAGKPFTTQLADVKYDRHAKRLVMVNGSSTPGVVSRYTLAGTPVAFSSLGTPWFTIEPSVSADGDVAIDQSGTETDGNFYVRAGGFSGSKITGYKPDGSKIPFDSDGLTGEGECGLAVTPDGQEVTYAARGGLFHLSPNGDRLGQDYIGPNGAEPGTKNRSGDGSPRPCNLAYDNNGDIYSISGSFAFNFQGPAIKISPTGLHYYMLNHNATGTGVAVDHATNEVFVLNSSFGANNTHFELLDEDGRLLGGGWGKEDPGKSYPGLATGSEGITVDPETHDVWIANTRDYGSGQARVEKFVRTNPHVIPDTTALSPEYVDPDGEHMLLKGIVNPDGVETTECVFAYGTEPSGIEEGVQISTEYELLTQSVPCEQGNTFDGTEDHLVTAEIPTTKGETYWYKLFAKNGNEQLAPSNVQEFLPQGKPKLTGFLAVDRVNTDGVRFSTEFDPNGGNASVHFEWGEKGEGFTKSSVESETFGWESPPTNFNGENVYLPGVVPASIEVQGLTPGTTYEYRAVVTNEAGEVTTQTEEFTTYAPDSGIDTCGNAEVRRQQNGSLLPDCRGYELVSAADQGGYDVESEIVPGQAQLDAYPHAEDRVLYSMHFGIIPGIAGSPTNLGLDPYVATRGANGWTTTYEGLPSNGMQDQGAFGSPLLGADASLENFAFGGPDICDPCFPDESTNVPLRRPNGALEKGMAGSLNPPADPAGEVRKPLSEDGTHFVFGSEEKFHEDGLEGSVTIYDRNLTTKFTQVVSTTPTGDTMTGEVAQLDISTDGSHILIGEVVDEDAAGNRLYDLYMHVGNNASSIEVVDTTDGVIYNGMTDDGGQVFFTTREPIAGDADTSADLFRADVSAPGPATVTWLSTGTGGTGNTDSCEPAVDWNVPSGEGDCSVVVPAGGAGVARNDGTVYFISPEKLDGSENGTADEANLYVVEPGGSTEFVGEIDSSAVKPPPQPPAHPVISTNFITSLSNPEGMAVDQATGDIYVAERGSGGRIARFDSTGAPLKFPEGPGAGTNRIPNSGIGGANESSIAIDSSGSPLGGAIYVRNFGGTVAVWNGSGVKLGELTGFGEVCGVAVDQNTGELFVGDYFGRIRRFVPNTKSNPVSKADYTETTIRTSGQSPCHVAADSAGHVFAASYSGGQVRRYDVADFSAADPEVVGTEVTPSSYHLTADPATGELYVSLGNRIAIFDSSGSEIGEVGSSASLGSGSDGVAVLSSTKEVFALNNTNVTKFGYELIPYEPINNPAILHGVEDAGAHHYEDFQVSPDGRYALFATPVSLTGYQNLNHYEIHRYDTEKDELLCVSCAPTNAVGKSDVKLSPRGLNLADDGRVFFTTLESLTLRDTNEKKDAYEWNEGKVGIISSGIGQDDSALLSVSADGDDAYFFTRDVLVPFDKNGNVVKIYDARVKGGFLHDPSRGLCKASDECHGPGTQPPPPPDINTITGPEQARPPVSSPRPRRRCSKRKVRRRGKCVPRKRQRKRRRKRQTTRRHG